MSLNKIKSNPALLKDKSKDELIDYINQLLLRERNLNSKIFSLKAENGYLVRNFNKVQDLIKKIVDHNKKNDHNIEYKSDYNG